MIATRRSQLNNGGFGCGSSTQWNQGDRELEDTVELVQEDALFQDVGEEDLTQGK